eukprot:jgi/Astpho2/7829/e_gw1.00117.41.1_t
MVSIPKRGIYIDGTWKECSNRLDVINPFNEEVVGTLPAAGKADVDEAVAAASRAFKRGDWSKQSGKQRARFLRAIADKVKDKKDFLAKLETTDNGKPIQEAEWDMDDVAACFEYYADLAEKLDERQWAPIDVPMAEFKSAVRREPLGVIGLICPWNYPLLMSTWKVAPALAAGNCVVLKPSETASLTNLELAAIIDEVGLPPGVFNLLVGLGKDCGAPLSAHPDIAKVAFTGSGPVGRQVNLAAAHNVKPATLELGGKSALIVFDDADIDKAVEWAMFGVFWTCGQICSSTSRLLVQEGIADKFYKQLKQRAESIKISDPMEEDCRLGPVISAMQYKKVMGAVERAKQEGATLLTGGKRPSHLKKGYFVEPTVFIGLKPDMDLWRNEVFGPVLAAMTFKDEAEAIHLANDSIYGLGAAIISEDEKRLKRVAEAMEVGIVWLNCSQPCFCQAPWGGVKASGHGRELGEWGLEAYLSVKQITTYVSQDRWDWFPKAKL